MHNSILRLKHKPANPEQNVDAITAKSPTIGYCFRVGLGVDVSAGFSCFPCCN